MSNVTLTEATVRAQSSPESYSRGASYFAQGAVGSLVMRGNTLSAEVEGSGPEPYRVRASFEVGGVSAASCTCPYDWGGWCKHIVAALLKAIYEPAAIDVRPPLDELLADLDRAQLLDLLLGLAEDDPDTADAIERRAELLRLAATVPAPAAGTGAASAPQAVAPARRMPIDQNAIRRQVGRAMRAPSYGDYDYYDDEEDPAAEAVAAVRPVLEQANRFVEAGDPASALDVLEALTEAYIGGRALWEHVEEVFGDYEGEAVEFLDEIAGAWAEALLSADLDRATLNQWAKKIAGWRDEADADGAGEAFDLALTAAEQGWDYPPLARALRGQISEHGAWEGEAPEFADKLALVRLRILERQGRAQEYLHLAEAEGQLDRYVVMLAKLGRAREAIEEGLKYLAKPAEAAELAKILRERGELDGALRIAERGLELETSPRYGEFGSYGDTQKAELASWASELALGMGQPERAQRAAEAAFRAAPSLSGYLRAQELAGQRWESAKQPLLAHLRRWPSADAKVDVFLHERLYDDAIAAVKGAYSQMLVGRVMDAVVATRPDWVIGEATKRADEIMDAGKADRYDTAVEWLRRARAAFQSAGRAGDWEGYIAGVRARHGRKHKLMGLLAKM